MLRINYVYKYIKIHTYIHTSAGVAAFIEVKEYDDKTIQIYTDGSKIDKGSGQEWQFSWEMNSSQN